MKKTKVLAELIKARKLLREARKRISESRYSRSQLEAIELHLDKAIDSIEHNGAIDWKSLLEITKLLVNCHEVLNLIKDLFISCFTECVMELYGYKKLQT